MNLDRFVRARGAAWQELDRLADAAGGRRGLDADAVLRLGELYRAVAADLAYARRRWPGDPLVARLAELVNRARIVVYGVPDKRSGVRAFFTTAYWVRVVERPALLALSALLLFAPLVATGSWAARDPGAAANLVPDAYEQITEPKVPGRDLGTTPAQEAAISSSIFTNNIQVTFLAFAAGVLVGLGTAVVLGFNGIFIGALGGLAIQAGNGVPFVELVMAHGVLELSCIVVTGAAGLRLGWAIAAPGTRPRREAIVDEGRRGVEIVLGTMPWLVLAGLVEGFVTPAGLGIVVNSIVGVTLGGAYWGLALVRGRAPGPDQRRALAFARR